MVSVVEFYAEHIQTGSTEGRVLHVEMSKDPCWALQSPAVLLLSCHRKQSTGSGGPGGLRLTETHRLGAKCHYHRLALQTWASHSPRWASTSPSENGTPSTMPASRGSSGWDESVGAAVDSSGNGNARSSGGTQEYCDRAHSRRAEPHC